MVVWHGFGPGGAVTLPASRSFDANTSLASCDVCLSMYQGCSGSECDTTFFVQGGSLSVTTADKSNNAGRLRAAGSNLRLVEWDEASDQPVANAKCIELAQLDFDVSWGISGSCSGDSCDGGFGAGGCCSDAPYCTNSTGSIYNRYCSTTCSGTSEGCAGPENCCPGYTCFLGSCMSETCASNSCTAGFDGGGCCAFAPYCTNGSCRYVCGDAGDSCASDFDCCSSFSCNGGTCS